MFGYDSDELNGLSCEVLFPSGQPLTTKDGGSEVQVMNKNGQLLTVELVQSHLDLGHRSMLLLLLRDITVRRQNEQMKDEFVSTVSHELRTPLTAISGALGLLAAGTLGRLESKQQQMLDIALQSSQHLNTLINDLLDIEKLVAGKMELFCKPIALQPLLLQAMQRHLPLATQKGIQIDALWPMPFNEQVNVDSNRLQQVLANLFVNAIRFSPAGTSVQVKAEIIATRVRVSICDVGPGVPIEFEGRLFQKFSQADSSDSRAVGGTGLGLAICKQLIEHMHGYIGYLPNEPQGACFYFELPLA
jgi:signal transduction histidine kinase